MQCKSSFKMFLLLLNVILLWQKQQKLPEQMHTIQLSFVRQGWKLWFAIFYERINFSSNVTNVSLERRFFRLLNKISEILRLVKKKRRIERIPWWNVVRSCSISNWFWRYHLLDMKWKDRIVLADIAFRNGSFGVSRSGCGGKKRIEIFHSIGFMRCCSYIAFFMSASSHACVCMGRSKLADLLYGFCVCVSKKNGFKKMHDAVSSRQWTCQTEKSAWEIVTRIRRQSRIYTEQIAISTNK